MAMPPSPPPKPLNAESVRANQFAVDANADHRITGGLQSSCSGELPRAGFECGVNQRETETFAGNTSSTAQMNAGQSGIQVRKQLLRSTRIEQLNPANLLDSVVQIILQS